MKRIGILTFHKSINYGSVLQAWSLCQTLKDYDVEVIDYEPKEYKKIYGLFSASRGLKYNINRLFNFTAIKNQAKLFESFRNSYLKLSASYKSENISSNIFEKYDAVVTGSDQIWNIQTSDADDIFFLPYSISAKKIAYACSINDTNFKEKRCDDNLKERILNYDFISIREKSGVDKVSQFIDYKKKVYTMLDPTLLNTKEMFEEITSVRLIKEPYIFLYIMGAGVDVLETTQKISKIMGLPVYTIMTKRGIKQILKIEKHGIKMEKKHTSPSDFLSLVKYSEMVITESFHGTAFSLIFEKKFICINTTNLEGMIRNDQRIINILGLVGLSNRYICQKDVSTFDFNEDIDYNIVTKKRMEEASYCKSMLKGAIEGDIKS